MLHNVTYLFYELKPPVYRKDSASRMVFTKSGNEKGSQTSPSHANIISNLSDDPIELEDVPQKQCQYHAEFRLVWDILKFLQNIQTQILQWLSSVQNIEQLTLLRVALTGWSVWKFHSTLSAPKGQKETQNLDETLSRVVDLRISSPTSKASNLHCNFRIQLGHLLWCPSGFSI